MKTNKVLAVMAIACTLAFAGCTKEGPPGPTGPTGAAGANGSANVTSITLDAGSWWTWDATNLWSYVTWTGISQLSAQVVNQGAVMLYFKNGSDYIALPYTLNLTTDLQEHANFVYAQGTISVFVEWSDFSNPTPPAGLQFKLVCIPPAALAANPNVNLKNYQEVASTFNLK